VVVSPLTTSAAEMKLLPAVLFVLPFSCLARPQQKLLLQPIPNLATLLDTTDDLSILNLLFQYNATVLAPLAAANDVTFLAPSDEAFRKLLEGDRKSPRCGGGRKSILNTPPKLG
jgi:hypothetical protein